MIVKIVKFYFEIQLFLIKIMQNDDFWLMVIEWEFDFVKCKNMVME